MKTPSNLEINKANTLIATVGNTPLLRLNRLTGDLPPLVHPRHLGTVPRWLGTYVRDEKLMSWEEAIRKLAGLPADILSLEDRGTLAEGNFADIVVFDPETIDGRATFEDPFHYSVGMEYVFVNGIAVVNEGDYTGALPGRALRGPAYEPAQP